MFVAKSFICYEVISNQRQISCLAGFNWMSNQAWAAWHVATYIWRQHVSTHIWQRYTKGAAGEVQTLQIPENFCTKSKMFLCKWAWCENHEKPIGLFFVFFFYGCFASVNIKILRLLVVEVPSSHRTMWLDSCKDQVFIRDYWSSYE